MTTKTLIERWIFLDEGVSPEKVTIRVVRNSVPADRGLHDRSNRVHTAALETMKRVLNANLQAMSQAQSWAAGEGPAGPSVEPIELPASSSPYAVRLAYLSGSLLNASATQEKYAEFDRHVDNWELDLGANDVARFEEKVQTMVMGVVAAMIGRESDPRFDMINEIGVDAAISMGVINPLTNLYDKVETRENRFVSILNPSLDKRFPQFVDQTYDADAKQYTSSVMQALIKMQATREARNRELLVSDKAFRLSQKVEYEFEANVWKAFSALWKNRKEQTLVKYEFEQPMEGEEYPIQEISSVGGIPTAKCFSLGNGISVVVEAAEIARTYLETLDKPDDSSVLAKRPRLPMFTRMRSDTKFRRRDGSRKPTEVSTYRQNKTPRVTYTLAELEGVTKDSNEDLYEYFVDSGVVLNERTDYPADDTFTGLRREDVEVTANDLGEWLANHFRGYCYQRQHTLDRPLFARLIDCTASTEANEVLRLNASATAAGFRDLATSSEPSDKVELGRYHYYRALRAAGGNSQTGRRMRRLGRYYAVSLCPVSKFSARSYMRYGEWWGTKSEHTNVKSEVFQVLRPMATQIGSTGNPELLHAVETAVRFDELFIFEKSQDARYFASRLLLLVETTQTVAELHRDAGSRNRTQVAREDVKQAQIDAARAVLTFAS